MGASANGTAHSMDNHTSDRPASDRTFDRHLPIRQHYRALMQSHGLDEGGETVTFDVRRFLLG